MRCNEPSLSQAAAKYAVVWFKQVIPFNRRRVAATAEESVMWHRQKFNETGRFRAIRYAARRTTGFHQNDDSRLVTKGMNCSHFVTTCYQVAGLEKIVSAAPPGVKVQDKKARYSVDEIPSQYRTFLNTFEALQSGGRGRTRPASTVGRGLSIGILIATATLMLLIGMRTSPKVCALTANTSCRKIF